MTPNPLGIPEFAYAVLIVALTCLVVFGVIYLFKALYRIRDYLYREAVNNEDCPWLLRILVTPLWLVFATICLCFTAVGCLIILLALRDARNWWHKDKK